ncbi:MAG: hypothetical protein NTX64_14670 [Elusimicrobia bacterium]|nr:hypothetical protein [Elusimicrobiota bacterium]
MAQRDWAPLLLLLLVFAIFSTTVVVVIRYFQREPQAAGGFFAQRSPATAAPQAAPGAPSPAQAPAEAFQRSGLPLVSGGSWGGRSPDETAPAQTPPQTPPQAEAKAPPGPASFSKPAGTGALSESERSLMERAVGTWNDAAAFALGSDGPRLFKLGEVLLRYPRVVGAILNNSFLVKGFMSSERVRNRCRNPQGLVNYLTNTADPNGIRLATKTYSTSLSTPGSTAAIFGSKLVAAVLNDCPAIQTIINDPHAVGQIAMADNGIMPLMSNPAFVTGLAANPVALGTFNAVQTSMTGGRK